MPDGAVYTHEQSIKVCPRFLLIFEQMNYHATTHHGNKKYD